VKKGDRALNFCLDLLGLLYQSIIDWVAQTMELFLTVLETEKFIIRMPAQSSEALSLSYRWLSSCYALCCGK
jgi:hypothetical protein